MKLQHFYHRILCFLFDILNFILLWECINCWTSGGGGHREACPVSTQAPPPCLIDMIARASVRGCHPQRWLLNPVLGVDYALLGRGGRW